MTQPGPEGGNEQGYGESRYYYADGFPGLLGQPAQQPEVQPEEDYGDRRWYAPTTGKVVAALAVVVIGGVVATVEADNTKKLMASVVNLLPGKDYKLEPAAHQAPSSPHPTAIKPALPVPGSASHIPKLQHSAPHSQAPTSKQPKDGGESPSTHTSTHPRPEATPPLTTTPSLQAPIGGASEPGGHGKHVMWVIEENHGYNQIMNGSNAPYIQGLATRFGYMDKTMHAETHPSLGNYVDLVTGHSSGITDDNSPSKHQLTQNNIFRQLGQNWTGLIGGMPSNCDTSAGSYPVKHNPAAYFVGNNGADRANCLARDMPLRAGETGDLSKALTVVVPDLNHDMHDGSVHQGDDWLLTYLGDPSNPGQGTVFASPEWQSGNLDIIVTFDEDDHHSNQVIPTIVISKNTSGVASTKSYNHYSILAATDMVLGLPVLGDQQSGTELVNEFKLGR